MTLSIHKPYQQITVTHAIYRAITRVRKTGATVTCARRSSTQGRFTVMHDVVITGTGVHALREATKLDQLIHRELYTNAS